MDRVISVAVDLSGSAESFSEKLAGCINAWSAFDNVKLILLGDTSKIKDEISSHGADDDRIKLVSASQEISDTDAPVQTVRDRKDSALVKGLDLVKNGEAGAFLSGSKARFVNTGAQMILGRIERLSATPMATLINGRTKHVLLLDSGSMGVSVKPADLVMFARMASLYMRFLTKEQHPVVGLLSDSIVPENGGMLYKDAYELLKRFREIEFCGTVMPEEILSGKADIIVCDGFAGSLILNMMSVFSKDISTFASVKRKHLFFGKNKETENELQFSGPELEGKGITFFPGIQGNVLGMSDKPYRETVQKAIGYAARLIKEDIKGRLISLLRL